MDPIAKPIALALSTAEAAERAPVAGLARCIERPRLAAAMAFEDGQQALWVCGPPGCGKSTLIAQYALAQPLPCIWYTLSPVDEDPVALCDALYRCAAAVLGEAPGDAPPCLRPEHRGHEANFAAQWWQRLLGGRTAACILVLDNLQCATTSDAAQRLLAALVQTLPPSSRAVLISHERPALAWADLLAYRKMAVLPEAELAFDVGEAASLLGSRGRNPAHAELYREATAGWAAALTVMLEVAPTFADTAALRAWMASYSERYFAEKLLEMLGDEQIAFVRATALLPFVTPGLAQELTGRTDAAACLAVLAGRGVLVSEVPGQPGVYRYHDLLRRSIVALPTAQAAQTVQVAPATDALRCAQALHRNAFVDDAVRVLLDAGAWPQALRLIEESAAAWVASQRGATLLAALQICPKESWAQRPWLQFWAGVAALDENEAEAREWLEAAYDGFERAVHSAGLLATACTMVTALSSEFGSLAGLDRWLARLARHLPQRLEPMQAAVRPWVQAGLLSAAMLSDASSDLYEAAREAAAQLQDELQQWLQGGQAHGLSLARVLFEFHHYDLNHAVAEELVLQVREALKQHSGAGPLPQARWHLALANYALERGQADRAEESWAAALALCAHAELGNVETKVLLSQARFRLMEGDEPAARALLARAHRLLRPQRLIELTQYLHFMARAELLAARPGEALRLLDDAEQSAQRAGQQAGLLRVIAADRANALLAQGQCEEAQCIFVQQGRLTDGPARDMMACQATLAAAWSRRGEPDYAMLLQQALAQAQRLGFKTFLRFAPQVVSRLCADALEADIETGFVSAVITSRRLSAPESAGERWPWVLRVYLLEPFRLVVRGEALDLSGKLPQKPLELLKLLVVTPTHQLELGTCAQALWPEGDAAGNLKNLEVVTGRLRKLLGEPQLVRVADGRIGIRRDEMWSDQAEFVKLCDRARDAAAGARRLEQGELMHLAQRIFLRYRGELLAGDDGPSWLAAAREQTRQRFLAAVTNLVRTLNPETLVGSTAGDVAEQLLARALEHEPVAEELYQVLIRVQLRKGDANAAMRSFRRCRDMLSIVLGRAPAAATRALVEGL